MNPVERIVRRIDAFQQRHTPTAFTFGVIKKYGDDNGGVLASNLAYSGFISLFPLLLILMTVLGLIASADPAVKADVSNAVFNQIPIIGHTLQERPPQLQRNSVIGLIVGLLGLIWGATGLAQAGLFTMEQVWNLPGPERPGFFPRLLRSLTFIGMLGVAVIVTTLLASLNTYGHNSAWLVAGAEVVAGAANVGMFLAAFRILTPKGVPTRALLPGAAVGGIVYTMLQVLGTFLVHHFLHSDSAYGVFGAVLGFIAWIYLAVQITVYSAEINVVLARRLWPRSIVQPPLTEADRHSMALQALQNQRRLEQHVEVKFTDSDSDSDGAGPVPPNTPRTPDEISPPAHS
jgi:YihY family inner membrane protein